MGDRRTSRPFLRLKSRLLTKRHPERDYPWQEDQPWPYGASFHSFEWGSYATTPRSLSLHSAWWMRFCDGSCVQMRQRCRSWIFSGTVGHSAAAPSRSRVPAFRCRTGNGVAQFQLAQQIGNELFLNPACAGPLIGGQHFPSRPACAARFFQAYEAGRTEQSTSPPCTEPRLSGRAGRPRTKVLCRR